MDIYTVTGLGHPATGAPSPEISGHWVQRVNQVSVSRFGSSVRRQIGSVVKTLSADSVFIVRDGTVF